MDEIQTLNSEMPVADSSSADTSTPDADATSESSSAETLKTEGDKSAKSDIAAKGDGKKAVGDSSIQRFDQHPDWQRMLSERNAAKEESIALKAKLETIAEMRRETRQAAPREREVPERNFDAELSKIDDALDSGSISMLEHQQQQRKILREQAREEAKMDAERITEHATQSVQHMMQQQQARSLRDQYLTDNPDFLEWQKSGVLDKVKKSDKYGFHDDFSASIQYQLDQERESKAADIAKAVKDAEARILKQFKIKGESRTLGAAPVTAPSEEGFDPALKDPKKYGGKTNVLAQRLAERRREAH